MNREIKFRAFDKEENKMFKPIYETYKGNLLDLSISFCGELLRRTLQNNCEHESMFKDRYKIMQFTGLKDKNGVDIYEGDVVRFIDDVTISGQKDICESEVFWWDLFCQFALKNTHQELNWLTNESMEIIGNIYENPELIQIKQNE